MRVLVVAPHPDDEAIGCGGTILLHSDQRDEVTAVFLTSGELGLKDVEPAEARRRREAEAEEAADILGISRTVFLRQPDWFVGDRLEETGRALRRLIDANTPDRILVPHQSEWHPDHAAACKALAAALHGQVGSAPQIWRYEVWTPLQEYDEVQDVSAVMARKLEAVRAYRSQIGEFAYADAVEGLNRFRGALAARTRYAEVFGTAFDGGF